MKNIIRVFFAVICLSTVTVLAHAQSCSELNSQSSQRSAIYQPKLSFEVIDQKGFRTYFYTAPSEQCKQKSLFLISKDSIITYEEIRISNQTWISVMYVRNDGSTVEGWMKKKDFKQTGKIGF
ncbi:hypothetical protein [Acinetobacter bohemicus]|uniref:hypothetical protein n=1 Tax=Acinetobacter bohemicus TaxID=1435036 RepID=UPI004042D140